MEFHCLWFTTSTEFRIWKKYLDSFPYPLIHKHYKSIKETNLELQWCTTSICFWSEKEYHLTSKVFHDFLRENKKTSLLIIKNVSFALKAFELGVHDCILYDDLHKKFNKVVTSILSYNFKTQNKPLVFRNKLYLPMEPDRPSIHFIEFYELIHLYSMQDNCYVVTVNKTFKTKIPFLWLAVQCELPELRFCNLSLENLLNTDFIKSISLIKHRSQCQLFNSTILQLTPKQHYRLQRYLKIKKQLKIY